MSFYKVNRFKTVTRCGSAGLLSLLILACASAPEEPVEDNAEETMVSLLLEDEIYSFHTHQLISDYTDRLAHDLMRNLRHKKIEQPMVVTSFVTLDDTLKNTSKLGNLISESLIGDMQAYSVPVIDIHLMGGIDITPAGDFVFSRSVDEIMYAGEVSYVLSGMLIESERGFTINARIMNIASKKVVSSASIFVPAFLIEEI